MLSISEQLFDNILEQIRNDKEVSADTMKDLFELFGEQCFQIVNILNVNMITKINSPCQQYIFRVARNKLHNTVEYNHCLIDGNLCTCFKFRRIVCKNNRLWCSHLAAAKIASVLNCYQEENNSQNAFDKLLMTIIL